MTPHMLLTNSQNKARGLYVLSKDLRYLFRHLHGGWVYEWPATAELQGPTGLVDSFREVHPDPLEAPGNSWSTVNKIYSPAEWNGTIPEVQDRIDLIFYKSAGLRTVSSGLYAGQFQPYPADVRKNDWPSDHFAFVSEFKGF